MNKGIFIASPHRVMVEIKTENYVSIALGGALAVLATLSFAAFFQVLFQNWVHNEQFSYGLLIPPIAGFLIWKRKDKLKHSFSLLVDTGLSHRRNWMCASDPGEPEWDTPFVGNRVCYPARRNHWILMGAGHFEDMWRTAGAFDPDGPLAILCGGPSHLVPAINGEYGVRKYPGAAWGACLSGWKSAATTELRPGGEAGLQRLQLDIVSRSSGPCGRAARRGEMVEANGSGLGGTPLGDRR